MEEYHQTRPHRRTSTTITTVTTTATATASTNQETQEENQTLLNSSLSKPMAYFLHQLEFISSPFLSLLSKPEAIPSRIACGLLAALHALAVLITVLAVAVIVGVGLVRVWVEEPVAFRSPLHFDYTDKHPSAVVWFRVRGGKERAVPAGHRMRVSVGFVMPESNFNRRIGVFQVTAEIIASNGDTITSSSQPCMLRFRSLPIRLMRTFLMGIPLLVGLSSESQKIEFEILRYEETSHKPTERIHMRLKPRAGTSELPQIYEAELLMNSQLPWRKEIVYNWKWTFYVWVSLYVYTTLLIVLTCCFKPLVIFPIRHETGRPVQMGKDEMVRDECEGYLSDEFSEALRRWRERSRSKRKVQASESIEESGSCVAGGETSEVIEDYEHFVASETSEC